MVRVDLCSLDDIGLHLNLLATASTLVLGRMSERTTVC